MTIAQATTYARQIAAADIGYSQAARWSWLDIPGKAIRAHGDGDCSSTTLGLLWMAGLLPRWIDGYTGNLGSILTAHGFAELPYPATPTREGDVVNSPGHHVVYHVSADQVLSAEYDENGNASGGQVGDQTGREVRIRGAYDMTHSGTRAAYLYRPPADAVAVSVITKPGGATRWLPLSGVLDAETVGRWQSVLGLTSTGHLDATLITAVQKVLKARDRHGYNWADLEVDGQGIGSNATGRYPKTGKTHTIYAMQADLGIEPDGFLSYPVSGSVKALQARLNTGRY